MLCSVEWRCEDFSEKCLWYLTNDFMCDTLYERKLHVHNMRENSLHAMALMYSVYTIQIHNYIWRKQT